MEMWLGCIVSCDNAQQFSLQRFHLHLITGGLRELGEDLLGIVLLAVEAAVDEGLDALAQGVEKGGDEQGGEDDGEGGLCSGNGR